MVSPQYKILAATDAYLQVTMRTSEELIGHDFLQSFPDNPNVTESKNERLLRESLDRVLKYKKVDYLDVLRYDIPKPAAQGGGFDIRYWEAVHTPVLNAEGEVECIIQRTNDVTEREVTKLALSESHEKFRFMAEAMPQLIFTTNADAKLTYLNQRWEKYTGIRIKELLYNGIRQAFHTEDVATFDARWQEAFEANTELQMELRIRSKEGLHRWHMVRILPKVDEAGQLMMWVGTLTDIHNPKQMVQELLETNTEMAQLAEHVQSAYKKAEVEHRKMERLIMESPAFFCILHGPEHRFELVNKNYQQLFPGRNLLQRTVAEALPEVIDQGFIQLLDKVYQTGESFTADKITIMLDKHDTGELKEYCISFQYLPLLDEQDKIYGILVFGFELPKS